MIIDKNYIRILDKYLEGYESANIGYKQVYCLNQYICMYSNFHMASMTTKELEKEILTVAKYRFGKNKPIYTNIF